MFFETFDKFQETSETGTGRRLDLRHQAIIEAHRDVLQGARVLDIAGHDGRWSFAALQAGASHVTTIEARSDLVDNARETFAAYEVDPNRYDLICSDVFAALEQRLPEVDVVFCLGFFYHTLRFPELLSRIRAMDPRHLVLDTNVLPKVKRAMIQVKQNRTHKQGAAAEDDFTHNGVALVGLPSNKAVEFMLGVYDFETVDRIDWGALIGEDAEGVNDYQQGARITWHCRTTTGDE